MDVHPTARQRYTGKRPPGGVSQPSRDPEREIERDILDDFKKARSRSPRRNDNLFTGAPRQERMEETFWTKEENSFWTDDQACIELEVDMPNNSRGWKRYLRDSQSYFISALKRRSIEVSERRMSQEEHQQFRDAKKLEVDKFIAAQALQAIPKELQPNKTQALRMRWVLMTWKKKDDGGVKPKARAVVLGYMDPDYANRPTFAPTMTRYSDKFYFNGEQTNERR